MKLARIEAAQSMLKDGLPSEMIFKYTKLNTEIPESEWEELSPLVQEKLDDALAAMEIEKNDLIQD